MKKIMFICTGNICRSAMAEKLMADKIEKEQKDIEVYSSGIFAEGGEKPTENAIEVMKERGIDLANHRATNIKQSNIVNMDLILCATRNHKNAILQMYPQLKGKVYTIKEYAEDNPENIDIKDPWGYDITVYHNCAQELEKDIDKIIKKL